MNKIRNQIIHTVESHLYKVQNQAKLISGVRSRKGYPHGGKDWKRTWCGRTLGCWSRSVLDLGSTFLCTYSLWDFVALYIYGWCLLYMYVILQRKYVLKRGRNLEVSDVWIDPGAQVYIHFCSVSSACRPSSSVCHHMWQLQVYLIQYTCEN